MLVVMPLHLLVVVEQLAVQTPSIFLVDQDELRQPQQRMVEAVVVLVGLVAQAVQRHPRWVGQRMGIL
jgi:hypothetical protein